MAVLRELIQTATHIIGQAFEAKEDVQSLVDDAERRIFGLAERRLEGSAIHVKNILNDTFKYIERLYERKEHVTGVPTGFTKLDQMTAGFQPSDLIIIAGRPSMGKTAFALNIAQHVGVHCAMQGARAQPRDVRRSSSCSACCAPRPRSTRSRCGPGSCSRRTGTGSPPRPAG